jgi:glycosyltransferase involved in cell wall biosynthesis
LKASLLFVQKRTHRAGAQTCLARLLRNDALQQFHPALLCSEEGWLAEECRRLGVSAVVEPFPSARSLAGRLWQNAAFARKAAAKLRALGIHPRLVHANDHEEGLVGLSLARECRTKSAVFLRSTGMSRRDYLKHRCRDYDLIVAVGDELRQRVQNWDAQKAIKLIHDGIDVSEFSPPKPKAKEFPGRILVLGSPLASKGWKDLTEAIHLLGAEMDLSSLQLDFTGARPDPAVNNLKLERIPQVRVNFLGRVEQFRELVLSYDLAVNPSRQESFGMAAVEVLAYGVPLLSTRSGIIEQVQESADWLCQPNPADLARQLKNLMKHWRRLNPNLARCQEILAQKFNLNNSAAALAGEYLALAPGHAW